MEESALDGKVLDLDLGEDTSPLGTRVGSGSFNGGGCVYHALQQGLGSDCDQRSRKSSFRGTLFCGVSGFLNILKKHEQVRRSVWLNSEDHTVTQSLVLKDGSLVTDRLFWVLL